MKSGKYPFPQKSKKSPGRAQQRSIQTVALTKGFGNQSQMFSKIVAKRRARKKYVKQLNTN